MADTDQAPSASKQAAVEAVTKKTSSVRVGDVVTLAVKSPSGKPEFRAPEFDRPIYAERTPGTDTWTASWVPTTVGDHEVTVSAADSKPAVFTVTAADREEN